MTTVIVLALLAIAALWLLKKSVRTVPQAHVAVVTKFGKYSRSLQPGLSLVNPFTAKIQSIIPVQNRTESLQFAAITEDQAAVHFTATIIYTVSASDSETIQLVAFKFINNDAFETALASAVEASVREFVAGKKQAEVLGLRQDIVDHAKHTLDDQLASWGYFLVDLTVNDITFDPEVMKSMSRVVSAKNAQTAASFEGEALLIARTKQAEAEGRAQVIAAENGAEAARLRGEGIAAQRAAIADGLTESGLKLAEAGIDVSMLAFSMWTEALRDVAINGKGNTIFLDGSLGSMEETLRRTHGFIVATQPKRHSKEIKTEFVHGDERSSESADMAAGTASATGGEMQGSSGTDAQLDLRAEMDSILDSGIDSAGAMLIGKVPQAEKLIEKATGVAKQLAAGWYPDPQRGGKTRYWNGYAWGAEQA